MPAQKNSQTPLTDAAKFMPSQQRPAFNLAQYMVKADSMAALELEHAALKAALKNHPFIEHALNPNDQGRPCLCASCRWVREVKQALASLKTE